MLWAREYRARPWGDRELLHQLATLNSLTFNHYRDPAKSPALAAADFMPDERAPEAPPSDADVLNELARFSF